MDEIYKIEKQFVSANIGFLEDKDRSCAHTTVELKDKGKLLKILNEEFESYYKWKFRKKFNSSQCTISLFEQENFMHIVCVLALAQPELPSIRISPDIFESFRFS